MLNFVDKCQFRESNEPNLYLIYTTSKQARFSVYIAPRQFYECRSIIMLFIGCNTDRACNTAFSSRFYVKWKEFMDMGKGQYKWKPLTRQTWKFVIGPVTIHYQISTVMIHGKFIVLSMRCVNDYCFFGRSYLVPTHLVPTHLVSTFCQLLLLFTHNLL